MNPFEAMANENPVYDPGVQQRAVQLAQVLVEQIMPADWDRIECLIQAADGGLHYTVTRAGDPSANLNVNLQFHRIAQQLFHYWQQRWGQSMPPVRVEVGPKPEGGWEVGFFVVPTEPDEPGE
jgi:hypothetical protein